MVDLRDLEMIRLKFEFEIVIFRYEKKALGRIKILKTQKIWC